MEDGKAGTYERCMSEISRLNTAIFIVQMLIVLLSFTVGVLLGAVFGTG